MTLRAWSVDDNYFRIDCAGGESTYKYRVKLKSAGARWNGKHWMVTDDQRVMLDIEKMVWVTIKGCHEDAKIHPVPESDAVLGLIIPFFCGRCDSHGSATVIAVEEN